MSENVLVVGRCRPFSQKEKQAGHSNITEIDTINRSIKLLNPKNPSDTKTFTFDEMFDANCRQKEVYQKTADSIVDAVLKGYNGTIFCYGQTGTGKTYSMQGITNDPELRGIIPTCFHHIFDHISRTDKKFLVRASFLEIYNEHIRDLLIKPKNNPKGGLELKENVDTGVYVKDLSVFVVKSVQELDKLMDMGNSNRSVGETLMNATSSRSHSIFTITVESSELGIDGEEKYVSGKLNLVDLAGSERQSKTGASGDRLKEATKINLSLSALGNCISALVDGKSTHIPYRDSKLTRMLQDSLGGNAKTLMIATLSPASYNFEETLSTLRYANRAKSIKNKPVVNEDPKDAMLREYETEIKRLRDELEQRQNGATVVTKVVKKAVIKKVKKKSKSSTLLNEDGEEEEEQVTNALAALDPETISRLQAEVEAEKRALLMSKDLVIEEKEKIAKELEKRALDLQNEKNEREKLGAELRAMEAKLLIGGVTIEEKINEQEQELFNKEAQFQEEERKKRILEKRLESKEEDHAQLEEKYSSLQEEVEVKTKKAKKLFSKLSELKYEIADFEEEFRIEKEDILETIRDLSKDLLLKISIAENFIPPNESIRLESQLVYEEETNDWRIQPSIKPKHARLPRYISSLIEKQPLCKYSKISIASGNTNPRFRYDNILTLQKLELPERSTLQDFAPRVGDQDNDDVDFNFENVDYNERLRSARAR